MIKQRLKLFIFYYKSFYKNPVTLELSLIQKILQACLYFKKWKTHLDFKGDPLEDQIPWMPFRCIEFLQTHIKSQARIFEFGSGGSTLFFAKHACNIVSVEHDAVWHAKLSRIIDQAKLHNIDYKLVVPNDPELTPESEFGNFKGDGYPELSFYNYVQSIHAFPDNYFDLVVVDGRARNDCLRHAGSKVKIGGYLLLDNAERAEYQTGICIYNHWKQITFSGPGPFIKSFWKTIIWQKKYQGPPRCFER